MNTKYLITATEVKTKVPFINNEIDTTLISNAILLVQNTLIKNSLTQDFYEDILTNSATTANSYLITNYIQDIIAYGVWQYLAVSLSLQLNAAGLRIKLSDHSQAAESVDIEFYRGYIQNFIDGARKEMDRYIEDHQADYPYYWSDKYGDKPRTYNFKIGCVGNSTVSYDEECNYKKSV